MKGELTSMGVKHGREYSAIIDELSAAVGQIDGIYRFFEMEADDWDALEAEEQKECIRTMADDLFYALGTDPLMEIEGGSVKHDASNHVIRVSDGDRLISIVRLV